MEKSYQLVAKDTDVFNSCYHELKRWQNKEDINTIPKPIINPVDGAGDIEDALPGPTLEDGKDSNESPIPSSTTSALDNIKLPSTKFMGEGQMKTKLL